MNYNHLFDLTPTTPTERLICSDWLEDQDQENLAHCLRNDYNCIDLLSYPASDSYQEPIIKISPLFPNVSGIWQPFDEIGQFRRISIPFVRRIYPQLIANSIVSVQPLLGPTSSVYYLNYRYNNNRGSND